MYLRVSIDRIALLAIDIQLVCAITILPHGTSSSNYKLCQLILTGFCIMCRKPSRFPPELTMSPARTREGHPSKVAA
jgi:hypothetical protein